MSPDKRRHRGAHPADADIFGEGRVPALRRATAELSWLLSRGYQSRSALKLVGDRHALRERQRLAVSRAACPDESLARRAAARVGEEEIKGAGLIVDGFNLVITVEAALGGGPLFRGRDRAVRDLSSVHGSYRSVDETEAAIRLAGCAMSELKPASALWLLDRPVSNSGRLARRIRELAARHGWPWEVEVTFNPDREIVKSSRVAVTSDSNILDAAPRWLNFNEYLIGRSLPDAWVIDLSE
ncbi:MAG TPA: DUF434 domain-containing protein [Pyrinomonadaceae bacterium]|nr:DUF434 domain-containing protein [Pyrinomonadaceae bacterium]